MAEPLKKLASRFYMLTGKVGAKNSNNVTDLSATMMTILGYYTMFIVTTIASFSKKQTTPEQIKETFLLALDPFLNAGIRVGISKRKEAGQWLGLVNDDDDDDDDGTPKPTVH